MLSWLTPTSFPVFLAPMAGFTDFVFRQLCKEKGADVMVTEFVMADALLQEKGYQRLRETIDFADTQRPMGIQLFGSVPEKMAAAAQRVDAELQPDFIDLNFGCPSPKIVGNCAGSSLLRDLPQLQKIVLAVVNAVPRRAVTVKMRIGWDSESIVALEAGQRIQDAGARMLTIHGRTKAQGYSGEADWETIHAVARELTIPVIGNGSIRSAADVIRARDQGTVAGVMIGRAALGNPWIFREIQHELSTGEKASAPTVEERWRLILGYADALSKRPSSGRWADLKWMRPRIKSFTHQIKGGRRLRYLLDHISTFEELESLARQHVEDPHSLDALP
jgi:nifR3 family TIM-barrel protein